MSNIPGIWALLFAGGRLTPADEQNGTLTRIDLYRRPGRSNRPERPRKTRKTSPLTRWGRLTPSKWKKRIYPRSSASSWRQGLVIRRGFGITSRPDLPPAMRWYST